MNLAKFKKIPPGICFLRHSLLAFSSLAYTRFLTH